MTNQQAPERIWIDEHGGNWSPVSGGTQSHEFVRADLLEAAEKRIADLEENMRIGNESWSRLCEARSNALTEAEAERDELAAEVERLERDKLRLLYRVKKAEAERDQAIRREQALKSSYDGERKALVENIRLRERIKELEGVIRAKDYDYNRAIDERDQALASVGAVIEKAADKVATPDEDDDALDKQTRLIASEQLRHDFNPDATAALNEMLAEAWAEGRMYGGGLGTPDDNPYRKGAT